LAFAERNLKKADLFVAEGQLEYRSYEKDGRKRTAVEIIINTGRGDFTLMVKVQGARASCGADCAATARGWTQRDAMIERWMLFTNPHLPPHDG
jgi:single-stranded DNA-binding protein